MWNFCFPVAPRSVNKLDSRCSSAPLFTAPMSGDITPMAWTHQSRWLPARCTWGGLYHNIDRAANGWKNVPEQSSGNQSKYAGLCPFSRRVTLVLPPAMFEQRLCLHTAVLTESEGPTEKVKRGAPLIKDWHNKGGLSVMSTDLFSFSGKSPPAACVRYPTNPSYLWKNNSWYMSLVFKNGIWDNFLFGVCDRLVTESPATNKSFFFRDVAPNSWWKPVGAAYQSGAWCFQCGVKVELGSMCFDILPLEKFRKKEKKKKKKKVEVTVSQENKPFPEPNTAVV